MTPTLFHTTVNGSSILIQQSLSLKQITRKGEVPIGLFHDQIDHILHESSQVTSKRSVHEIFRWCRGADVDFQQEDSVVAANHRVNSCDSKFTHRVFCAVGILSSVSDSSQYVRKEMKSKSGSNERLEFILEATTFQFRNIMEELASFRYGPGAICDVSLSIPIRGIVANGGRCNSHLVPAVNEHLQKIGVGQILHNNQVSSYVKFVSAIYEKARCDLRLEH
jgi:hypothetical protein